MTLLNEAHSLPHVLDGIARQTLPPDEVVVCDGGSSDGTLGMLHAERRFPLRVIEAPGVNISRGRNLAIAAAAHDVIACTDAGTRPHERWLERLIAPFENPATQVSAGFFEADFDSVFELAMSATVLPLREEIRAATFLPSSRSVAFRKTAWQAVGGYPEWLDYCEDLIFDLALRDRFGAFAFAPDACVRFKPRGSLRSFFKQYFLYARGDGKAGLWPKRHLIRYATYLIAFPTLAALALVGPWPANALALTALIGGFAAYVATPYRRLGHLARGAPAGDRLRAALWIPVLRVWGDIAKMLGYPAGLLWRLMRSAGHRRAP